MSTINVDSSGKIGLKIIEMLGLPKHVRKLELIFEAGKPMLIRCEAWPDGSIAERTMIDEPDLLEYELVPKEASHVPA